METGIRDFVEQPFANTLFLYCCLFGSIFIGTLAGIVIVQSGEFKIGSNSIKNKKS